ncbi:hypothetical protein EMIT079MI2_40162 [Bacillus sp. IT-79MI2]
MGNEIDRLLTGSYYTVCFYVIFEHVLDKFKKTLL